MPPRLQALATCQRRSDHTSGLPSDPPIPVTAPPVLSRPSSGDHPPRCSCAALQSSAKSTAAPPDLIAVELLCAEELASARDRPAPVGLGLIDLTFSVF